MGTISKNNINITWDKDNDWGKFSELIIDSISTTLVYEKIEKTNLDTLIKVISPKIDINRFLKDVNPEKILVDLIKISKPEKEIKTIFIFPEGVLSNIYLQDLKNFSYIFSENFSNTSLSKGSTDSKISS